ncbi:MAG: flagellar biosynthesis anti-sigma factor FlgM [Sphingomonas sp.]|nr:flagellar biosynthesis anti-sigma factor FlgM [Sphingomonas sp.]
MVDPVGTKPVGNDRWAAPIDSVAPVQATRSTAQGSDTAPANGLSRVITDLAAAPPVDLDRVRTIRQAIANRTYPIVPETIADRLIALKLNWSPNEPA